MAKQRIPADALTAYSVSLFQAAGAQLEIAQRATDVLMHASLRGIDTHGIRNLKRYYLDASGIGSRDGSIDMNAQLSIDQQSPTTTVFNANGGLALSQAADAMQVAIDKAKDSGFAISTMRNGTHFGAAGYFASMALAHDMIGFASCGYFFCQGQPTGVLPFGGLVPMLSTNPLAMACPAHQLPPFVLDMSTSIVPLNRIELHEENAEVVPDDWVVNEKHEPTDKPSEVYGVLPLGGATTFGGHKGFGLSVATWILSGVISGAWRHGVERERILGMNPEPLNGYGQEGIAHSFAALRLDLFGDPTEIRKGIDQMILAINASPAAQGFDHVDVPGQRAYRTLQDRLANGVPVNEKTLENLLALSDEYNVPITW